MPFSSPCQFTSLDWDNNIFACLVLLFYLGITFFYCLSIEKQKKVGVHAKGEKLKFTYLLYVRHWIELFIYTTAHSSPKTLGRKSHIWEETEKFQYHALLKVSQIVMKKQDQGRSVLGPPNSSATAFFTTPHFLHAFSLGS